eukprot:s1199_g11.t2
MPDAALDEEDELNFQKWSGTSERRLKMAKAMIRDISVSLRENLRLESLDADAGLDQVIREQKQKKERVYTSCREHQNVIDTSYSCLQDMARASKQTVDSITQLTHQRYRGTANIQINDVRQELRSKRPPSELFKDILDEALEAEQTLLQKQREVLLSMEEEGKQIIQELDDKRSVLTGNSGVRRVKMSHDISSLNQKVQALNQKTNEDSNLPDDSQLSEDTKQMLDATFDLLHRYRTHRGKTLRIVEKFAMERDGAKTRTESALTKRMEQLTQRKTELESQLRELRSTVTKAERELDSSYRKLGQIGEGDDDDDDDVETMMLTMAMAMTNSSWKLAPDDTSKKEKLAADSELLSKLRRMRDKVDEDFRAKCTALEIDSTCKRVNAAKAGEAKLKKETNMLRMKSASNLRTLGVLSLNPKQERPRAVGAPAAGKRPGSFQVAESWCSSRARAIEVQHRVSAVSAEALEQGQMPCEPEAVVLPEAACHCRNPECCAPRDEQASKDFSKEAHARKRSILPSASF